MRFGDIYYSICKPVYFNLLSPFHSLFFHSYTGDGAVSSRIKQHFGIWIETFQSARFRARFPCYCRPESWLSGLVCNIERKAENESVQKDQ